MASRAARFVAAQVTLRFVSGFFAGRVLRLDGVVTGARVLVVRVDGKAAVALDVDGDVFQVAVFGAFLAVVVRVRRQRERAAIGRVHIMSASEFGHGGLLVEQTILSVRRNNVGERETIELSG